MPVTTEHPDYAAHKGEWRMMDEALQGENAIKANPKNLPVPAGILSIIDTDDGKRILTNYQERAQYEDWVKDSLRSMMGMVSRLKPALDLPAGMEYMRENATDDGFSVWQLFMRVVAQSVSHGRVPLVVNVDENSKGYIAPYKAESGINWKIGDRDGRKDLILAVFKETRNKGDSDEYGHDVDVVYRVFTLRDGACYTKVVNDKDEVVEGEVALKTALSTRPLLDYIPVIYCGSTDSSPDVDELPLLSMARAAVKSYQLSADYFTSLHQTSHPQPWVSGIEQGVDLKVTGPSAAWDLGPGGECGYLEFQGAGIKAVREAMKDQKGSALEAGAKVMDVGGQESGEARKARQDDQHATLHSIVITCAEAIQQALRYAAEWTGHDPKQVTFTVPPDFALPSIDSQLLNILRQDVLAGKISADTYWQYLTTGKLPEHDYGKEALRIENPGNIVDE